MRREGPRLTAGRQLADVQPLEAIRFAPSLDLSPVLCPPFDTISPERQRSLYDADPHNAVRLELPVAADPYRDAQATLRRWLQDGTLVRDDSPAFYVYDQGFSHAAKTYRRRLLFARLRVVPWEHGVVLPHERTFKAPKEDRLNLLRALRMNTSPILLIYPDDRRAIGPLLERAVVGEPLTAFTDADGAAHALHRLGDEAPVAALSRAFAAETLYVADGHHRYETALAYSREDESDPSRAFALAALVAAEDPGLLVLPIHRLVKSDLPVDKALDSLVGLFEVQTMPSLEALQREMAERGRMVNAFGLAAAGSPDLFLLTLYDTEAAHHLMPSDRSSAWRGLDAAVANHVILRHALGLSDAQMEDIRALWFEEDAAAAVAQVRSGQAQYAVLLNPISTRRVIAIADGGERMPQKSTFFYPKVPTGLVFNPLF